MKKFLFVPLTILLSVPGLCRGQVGGNISYSQENANSGGGKARAEQLELTRRALHADDKPPSSTSTFVEANVLINVKADEYVAVFGLAQEGETIAECSRKMDALAKEFTDAIKELRVTDNDLFLDFVTQTRIYGYEMTGEIAREKLVGFEIKKNLSIHYKDRDLLDKFTVAAAKSKIYDLIKVDYVVRDASAIQDKLMEEAAKVVKRKADRYEMLLGIKLQPPAQVFAEKYGTHYPTQLYDSYTAAESEHVYGLDRQRFVIQTARKTRTFVFNGLDGALFDDVINPVIIEPVVQFTIHLKVKYEVEQIKAK
jgi:uncharacterized protein YggE